jgi:hypothetical protein
MFRLIMLALASGLVLTAAAPAAWYTQYKREAFGPAPPVQEPPTPRLQKPDPSEVLRCSPGRCYLLEKGWSGWGIDHNEVLIAGQGAAEAVNVALAQFAKMSWAAREIRLFPAPGFVRSLDGKKEFVCDWQVHWTSHVEIPRGNVLQTVTSHSACFTLFIARTAPIPAPDSRTAGWIDDLNSDQFRVRERAFRELAGQRDAAAPSLREALRRNPTLEQRQRLEQLLGRLKQVHLLRVQLPKGVPVAHLDELLERQQEGWRSGQLARSWEAAQKASAWVEHSEAALPLLVAMLQDDRVQVRDLAVQALTRLGKRAVSVLPVLRVAEARAAATVRDHHRQAVRAVEQAPPVPDAEERWQENRRLRQDIAGYCRSLKSLNP